MIKNNARCNRPIDCGPDFYVDCTDEVSLALESTGYAFEGIPCGSVSFADAMTYRAFSAGVPRIYRNRGNPGNLDFIFD